MLDFPWQRGGSSLSSVGLKRLAPGRETRTERRHDREHCELSSMIAVTARLQLWTGAGGNSRFLVLPEEQAIEVRAQALMNPRGFGSVRVECPIGDIVWRTSLFPRKSDGYFLPMKADVCRRAGITADDMATVYLEIL